MAIQQSSFVEQDTNKITNPARGARETITIRDRRSRTELVFGTTVKIEIGIASATEAEAKTGTEIEAAVSGLVAITIVMPSGNGIADRSGTRNVSLNMTLEFKILVSKYAISI